MRTHLLLLLTAVGCTVSEVSPPDTVFVPVEAPVVRSPIVTPGDTSSSAPLDERPQLWRRAADSSLPARDTAPVVLADSALVRGAEMPDDAALRGRLVVPAAGVARGALSDSYNEMRGGSRRHEAMDILAPRGTPVVAMTAGRVLRLFNSRAGGLMVYSTDASERFILYYGHLDRYAPGLVDGMAIRQGQTIGYVGTSGNANLNTPHLHFGIMRSDDVRRWSKGVPLNPFPLF